MGYRKIRAFAHEDKLLRSSNKTQKFYKEPENNLDEMHHHDAINLIFRKAKQDSPEIIQPKLTVTGPTDFLEKEADAVANTVINMSDTDVQRKTDPLNIHAINTVGSSTVSRTLESEIGGLRGNGAPFSGNTRRYYEARFGTNFSNVRIHSNTKAEKLADTVNAQAFTYGSDIVFAKGKYSPESSEGKRLIAHELTHVIQQAGGKNNNKLSLKKKNNIIQRKKSLYKSRIGGVKEFKNDLRRISIVLDNVETVFKTYKIEDKEKIILAVRLKLWKRAMDRYMLHAAKLYNSISPAEIRAGAPNYVPLLLLMQKIFQEAEVVAPKSTQSKGPQIAAVAILVTAAYLSTRNAMQAHKRHKEFIELERKWGAVMAQTTLLQNDAVRAASSAKSKKAATLPDSVTKKKREKREVASMRFQVQWKGPGGDKTFSDVAINDPEIGVTVLQALASLTVTVNSVKPNSTKRIVQNAMPRAQNWIRSRPPTGVAAEGQNVHRTHFKIGKGFSGERIDIENIYGHNLRVV